MSGEEIILSTPSTLEDYEQAAANLDIPRHGNDESEEYILFPHHPAIEHFVNFAVSSEAQKWTDVTIVADESKIQCHKIILVSHSPFLKRILAETDCEESVTLLMPDVDVALIYTALEFIYKGAVADEALMREAAQLFCLGRADVPLESDDQLNANALGRSRRKRLRSKRLDDFLLNRVSNTEHLVKEEDEYDCCGTEFLSKADLEGHKKSDECLLGKIPDQENVPKVKKLKGRKSRKKLSKLSSNNSMACCDTLFEDEAVLASHKENVHLEKLGNDRYMICCNEKIFGNLKKHLLDVHRLDDLTEQANCCDDTFDGVSDLTKHCTVRHGLKVTQFKRVVCCSTRLSNVDEYVQHKEQADEKHVECEHCAFLSLDERNLDLHLYAKHKIGGASTGFSCKFCGSEFKSLVQRQQHEDKHDDSLKYSCSSCGKQFKLQSSLKSHLYRMGKNHNPAEKRYSCDTCDKIFPTIVSKRKHYRTDHQKKDAYACGQCELIFVDRHRLTMHTKSVHLKVKDIQCTYCGKLFSTQERMKIHEKFVHVIEDEKVPCDVCMKPFQNKERMSDHRRSVHRDRKYQCDECGSTFKNSSTLKSHHVSIHLSHDKKPLKCSICGKGFLHESRRKAHMLIHSDESPFACRFCGRPNKCKNNNLKHEKRCKKAAADATPGLPAAHIVVEQTDGEVVADATAIEFVSVSLVQPESVPVNDP